MQSTIRMPAVFIGHGTPMNALERNTYTNAWASLAESIPKPSAILAISAHWYTRGTAVTANAKQRTIHDFYGFPDELFAIQYAASGDPQLAGRVKSILAPINAALDTSWGIDHGAWSVLVHMYPNIDIPVLQLSIDGTRPAVDHYELGQKLRGLRDEGVLLLGSGNVVHNLGVMQRTPGAPAYDWANAFNTLVREAVSAGKHDELVHYERAGRIAQQSIPTPEHYLPLLYILGSQADDPASIVCDGIDLGSISMLSVKIG